MCVCPAVPTHVIVYILVSLQRKIKASPLLRNLSSKAFFVGFVVLFIIIQLGSLVSLSPPLFYHVLFPSPQLGRVPGRFPPVKTPCRASSIPRPPSRPCSRCAARQGSRFPAAWMSPGVVVKVIVGGVGRSPSAQVGLSKHNAPFTPFTLMLL